MFLKNVLFIITLLFALPSFAITVADIKKLHETYSEDNSILLQKFEEIEPQIKALPQPEQDKLYEEFFIKITSNEKFYEYYKDFPLTSDLKSQYINYHISYYLNDYDKLEQSLKNINKYTISDLQTNNLKVLYITLKSTIRNKQGAYYESLLILDEAEQYLSNINIHTNISYLNNKAVIHYYLKDYKNSNIDNKNIIDLYAEYKLPIDLTYVYTLNNIYYNEPNDIDNRNYLKKQLNYIIQHSKDKNVLANVYFIYGLIVSHYDNPIEYYDKSIKLYNELDIQDEVFYTKLVKGKFLAETMHLNQPHHIAELKKIVDEVFSEDSTNKKVFRLKSAYHKKINDYPNSLKYLEIYKHKYNEEFAKKFTTTIQDLKVLLDISNKEENNLNLVKDKSFKEFKIKDEQEIALEKNKQLFYSFLILCVLLFIIMTFIFFYKKTKEQATIDDLTKVYNRKHIIIIGENTFLKYEKTFSLILFDIDFFKKINDQFGHEIGDKVLFEFSQLIKQNLRRDDFLGRYGGEEFLIVTKANINAAYEMAERLREIVANYEFQCADLKITSSFGVVCHNHHSTFEQMLKDADDMLYIAKNNGRNKVVKKETK